MIANVLHCFVLPGDPLHEIQPFLDAYCPFDLDTGMGQNSESLKLHLLVMKVRHPVYNIQHHRDTRLNYVISWVTLYGPFVLVPPKYDFVICLLSNYVHEIELRLCLIWAKLSGH